MVPSPTSRRRPSPPSFARTGECGLGGQRLPACRDDLTGERLASAPPSSLLRGTSASCFVRDIVLQRAERPFIQTGFARHIRSAVVDKCPVGTPITVDDNRIGWRLLESSWMLLYDAISRAGYRAFCQPTEASVTDPKIVTA